jgi:hypothetical protein
MLGAALAISHPGHKKTPALSFFLLYSNKCLQIPIWFHRYVPKGSDFIISFNHVWCNHTVIKTFPKQIRQAQCIRSFVSIQCGCRLVVCRQACHVLLSELHSLYPMGA